MAKTASKRKGRQFWTAHVERFEQMEGVTQREFARQHGLVYGTFRHWLYQLRADRAKAEADSMADAQITEVQFVEVDHQSFTESRGTTMVEVGEVRLHVDGLPAPEWIVELAIRLKGGQRC